MSATGFNSSAPSRIPYRLLRSLTFRELSTTPNGIYTFQRWERQCRSAQGSKSSHWFMRECLAQQVLPNCLQYLAANNSSNHPFPAHWQAVMHDQIAFHLREKEGKFRQAHETWLHLF